MQQILKVIQINKPLYYNLLIIKGSPKDPLVVEKNMVTIHTTIKAKNKLKSLGKKEGCDENTTNTGKLYIDENIIKSFIQNCRKYN